MMVKKKYKLVEKSRIAFWLMNEANTAQQSAKAVLQSCLNIPIAWTDHRAVTVKLLHK